MSSQDTTIYQTTNQNDANLFSQLRFSRPLKDFISPVNVPTHPPLSTGLLLKQVFLLAHLDRQEDLRLMQWIEMNEDLLQTARELIPGKILNGLEARYKALLKQEVEFYKFYQQTLPELRKRITNQQQRVLIHYISRSIYNADGLIMAQDEQSRQPVSINVAELAKMINDKVIFIFDCNGAGKLIEGLLKQREVIGFASCLASQKMPFTNYQTSRLIPTDIFSICMTDPMLGLSISFIYRNEIRLQRNEIRSYQQLIQFYSKKIENVKIVNQILQIIKYITECLAFNNLDSNQFEQLFRIDDNTISVVQNYFVAQRVMSLLNLQTTTTLDLPDLSDHPLWISLDVILNEFFNNDLIFDQKEMTQELSRSNSVLAFDSKPNQLIKTKQFFTFEQDQIQSFELQLNYLNEQSKKPDNITIIISLLKQQQYWQKCFLLLCKFVDLCPSSISELSIAGLPLLLFNFILKKNLEPEIFRCVGFLLVKILSFDLNQAVRYVHYLHHQKQTKLTSNQRDSKSKLQLALIAEILHPKLFDISSRLIALQVLTIFTSKILNTLLRSSDNSEQSKLVNDIRFYIMHNQGLDLLKVLIHSSDNQIKLWATLLYGNLMSILPRYLGQSVSKSIKEGSSSDNLAAINTEDSFNLLQQEMTVLINLRDSSFSPEIRAAAVRAIGNCFLESKNQSTPVQNSISVNAYKFSLDEHFVQKLCLSIDDPSNLVRYELIRVFTKIIQCYLWSSIKEIERLLGQQFNYVSKQEIGNKFIPLILIALNDLSQDPNKLISLYAVSIINNLKNLSLMHIAKQYVIGNAYITANQSLMKISQDDPDFIQSNSLFLSRLEIKLFQEKIKERKHITEQDLITLSSRQDDDQLQHDDQINQDYASFRASLQLSFLSQNGKSLNTYNSQISSLMSESNIVVASQTTKLKLCETVVDSISIIQEVDTSTSRTQNITPETKKLKSVQIKYDFLKYKQQQLLLFDKMLSSFSFSVFYGKLQHAHTLFQSVILNIAFYGLQQQQITSNLIQLGQSISQRTHRSIQSCTQHHTLIGKEEGCRCRRLFTFQCQLCQKLAGYGINLGLSEKYVSNNSSCFVLVPDYVKSSAIKQKHVSSISQSSQTQQTLINYTSLVTFLSNVVNKEKMLERKILYIQELQNFQKQLQTQDSNNSFSNEALIIQYQQFSDYDLQNILLQMKQDSQFNMILKLKEKFSPQTCQSYIFSLLQMLSSEEMIQHNIPIQLCNQLPDYIPKHRSSIPFQVNSWKMTNDKLLNAQSQNNLNIMTEGLITQQTQQPYDSKGVQNIFNQPLVLVERFSKNQAQTSIQLTTEQQSQIALIDQSCTICRHIAVQHSLLNLSALSQFYFYQKQFIFYPTRDVRPLVILMSSKAAKKDVPSENQYSSFINKFVAIMASPFPYFDEGMFCESNEIFNHYQMARCIYRAVTNNYDILIPQFYLSHRLAAKQYSIQQMQNHDKESLWNAEPEHDWIVTYLLKCMSLYNQQPTKKFSQCISNKKDYSSSQLDEVRSFPRNERNINHFNHIARIYFKEQFDYLEQMRIQKQQQYCRNFQDRPKQISYYATITTLKKPYLIKFHPSAPFMFIVCEEGMYQYNVQQQLNCNNLSQQFLNDFSPTAWPGNYLQHQHTTVSPKIDSVEELMLQYNCGKNGQIYGHIQDSDIECQYCAICQAIKCSNGDDDYFINPDRIDHFMNQSFCQQAENKSQVSQLNLYPQMACPYNQIPKLISNRTHNVPDDKVVDIGFLNTDQPNFLMTTSGSKYTYRIFSNPLDIACTQQISSYQIFQRQNPFSVDTLCTLPVFDCMRHVAFESDNVDQELLNLYLEDKLNFCLAKLPSLQNQQVDMKHLFLTSAGYHNRNVAFSNYNEFKILDLVSEQFSKIQKFDNFNISALDYDEITQRVVFGDFDGSVRIFDLKSNEIIQSFENRFYFPLNISVFNNQASQHNIQVGFSNGRVKTYSSNQLVHEIQLCEETRNVICQKNMAIMGSTKDNKGLLSFNISGKKTKQDIKVDKFQKAFFNTDCDTFGTINDNVVKLYLMK